MGCGLPDETLQGSWSKKSGMLPTAKVSGFRKGKESLSAVPDSPTLGTHLRLLPCGYSVLIILAHGSLPRASVHRIETIEFVAVWPTACAAATHHVSRGSRAELSLCFMVCASAAGGVYSSCLSVLGIGRVWN